MNIETLHKIMKLPEFLLNRQPLIKSAGVIGDEETLGTLTQLSMKNENLEKNSVLAISVFEDQNFQKNVLLKFIDFFKENEFDLIYWDSSPFEYFFYFKVPKKLIGLNACQILNDIGIVHLN